MENDIYAGFTNRAADLFDLDNNDSFQNALKTSSYGKKNTTPSSVWRGGTGEMTAIARPSTAVRPAGYTMSQSKIFDPLNQAAKRTVVIDTRKEETPEQKYKNLEQKIFDTLEESILASSGPKPDFTLGLNKAKEASSLDRQLLRLRDQNGGSHSHNFDLTYSVLFNLANLYACSDMYVEALNTYTLMTKNKMFSTVNRLKINMGNIYYKLGLYSKAIKMYRMALDQVPSNQKELRLKITHNIGVLFVRMGQYSDAATSFEFIMSEKGDLRSGLHLILCYYALGNVEKIRRAFQLLLEVPIEYNDEDRIVGPNANINDEYIYDIIRTDELAIYEQRQKSLAEKSILMASNLISGVIEENFNDGYSWCVETIKSSMYAPLAAELDLNKAVMFLKQDDIPQAVETLKYFERKEGPVAVNAAINLTFIYLLKKDVATASKYAENARKMDSYNPAVFVNSGVCEMFKEDYDAAKVMFENALEIDPISFEALFNLGLIYKKLGDYDNAMNYFRKLQANLGHKQHPEVIYQIGNIFEHTNDSQAALEWYLQLLGLVQLDSGVFQKIGEVYENEGDRQQAFHYHLEAYRVNPINNSVINWIGSHYIELQVAEKAIAFYEKAALNNLDDPYFMLRVAGCYRRIGNPQKSMQLFQAIHEQFPDNLDCIRALMHLTQTQGMDDMYEHYQAEFQRVEKAKEIRQRIGSSRPGTTTSSRLSANGKSNVMKEATFTTHSSSRSIEMDSAGEIQVNYADPIGPPAERPKTGMRVALEEDSDEDLNAADLLPM
ncbi:intraflagellar transport protein 88 homolog [Culicoides brevitarsis]|uniref:intraflagellar transport protein 88 homolog n=1 Tax=Culicoides brevitarsis TaxID=469753 RepID=UPI00307BC618